MAQFPNTEIWLFKIEKDGKSEKLSKAINISNREGYDNQPSFSIDSKKIYYVSIHEDQQADIYSYELRSKKTEQITKTSISEYSPVENEKGTLIHSVVVEKDSAQRIHSLSVINGMPEKVIDVDSIGYYTFLNDDTLLYYKLTEPHSLRYFCEKTKEDRFLAFSPIRAFKKINRHEVIFGIKDSVKVDYYRYNFLIQKAQAYCTYPSLNEDFIYHPQLGLIKSEGTQLLRYDEQKQQWLILYDLSPFGLHKITRFAFDEKQTRLVVVDNLK